MRRLGASSPDVFLIALSGEGREIETNVKDKLTPGSRKTALEGRRFGLLQGPSSRFFTHLGRALRGQGAEVWRIGFCPGDRLFWRADAGRYLPYRGSPTAFEDWLADLMRQTGLTDLIMLGDGRAPHVQAIRCARAMSPGPRPWIVEHGYLRPDYILIEPDGMGGASRIPAEFDPEADAPPFDTGALWPAFFARYAAMDVAYHLANVTLSPFSYPHYRAHSGIHPFREYGGWLRKLAAGRWRKAGAKAAMARIAALEGPVFLFPLQLNQDVQILRYGTGRPQAAELADCLASFHAHAPTDAHLVVKAHPLDNGLTDWAGLLRDAGGRVIYLDGGDLDTLLDKVSGVVTINSTVGLTALQKGMPVLALGQSVYGRAGLCSDQALEDFWRRPSPPQVERVDRFCRFLVQRHHVRGAFDGPGAPVGAQALANWLAGPTGQAVEGVS